MSFAVFGGSFDPPHIGHVLAVHYVLTVGWVQGVVVVPVFSHAFDKESTPFDQRLDLCRAAFDGVQGVEVSDIERHLPEPSYTLRTVQELAKLHPDRTWRLLMGSDLMADAERWHRFDELARVAPPLILARSGHEVPDALSPAVLPEVSSSDVRNLLWRSDRAQIELLHALVPVGVRQLIESRGLYR